MGDNRNSAMDRIVLSELEKKVNSIQAYFITYITIWFFNRAGNATNSPTIDLSMT